MWIIRSRTEADVLGGTECSAVMSIKPVFKPKELQIVFITTFKIFFHVFNCELGRMSGTDLRLALNTTAVPPPHTE